LSRKNLVTCPLASGEPLAEVQRDAVAWLDFARQAGFNVATGQLLTAYRSPWFDSRSHASYRKQVGMDAQNSL